MKRKFLRFENIDVILPPDARGKFMRQSHYNGGGGANPQPLADPDADDPADTPEVKLEKQQRRDFKAKIVDLIKKQALELKLQNADDVTNAMTSTLGGLTSEQLKKFHETEVVAMQQSIKNMSAALKKLESIQMVGANPLAKPLNALKKLISQKETMDAIQKAMASKDPAHTVNLTVQAAVAAMTTGNVVDDGDIPEDILNSFSIEAFEKKRRPKEYIYDIASRRTVAEISEYKTWLEEGDEEGAFAIVVEGAVKPLVSKTLIRNTTKYKKVAGKRVYTEEFSKFRKEAYSILEDLFNDQLLRNYAAILTTNLVAAAAAYVGTILDGLYEDPTDYHAIGAVAAQIETLEFQPDLLIINPQDKWRINLSQASDGHFYVGLPKYNAATGAIEMMGYRVFTTNRIDPGDFILGESGLYKIEDEPVKVRLGYGINVTKNGEGLVTDVTSDIDTNRFRIIAETFFHSWISTNNVGSFVKATFDDVKAALLKEVV